MCVPTNQKRLGSMRKLMSFLSIKACKPISNPKPINTESRNRGDQQKTKLQEKSFEGLYEDACWVIRRGNPWFVSLQIDVMGLGSRDGNISIHMTAWECVWTPDSGGMLEGKWKDPQDGRGSPYPEVITNRERAQRGKSHAWWLWINISHLMSTPALCLQIINCQIGPCRFWHFHNHSIIYQCHSRGHYHGQRHYHYSRQDLRICINMQRGFFFCDFRKWVKRY